MPDPASDTLQQFLKASGLGVPIHVAGKSSIHEFFAGSRVGIYLLIFENGEHYIGQSSSLPRRYAQHVKSWPDIQRYAYLIAPESRLDSLECDAIYLADVHNLPLRNVKYASATRVFRNIDEIIPPDQQNAWLSGEQICFDDHRTALHDPSDPLQEKFRIRFQKLLQSKHARSILDIAQTYLTSCLPWPGRTERAYWGISCQPGTTTGDLQRVFCFNVNNMETFVLYQAKKQEDSFYGLLNLSKIALLERYDDIEHFKRQHPHCLPFDGSYATAGYDQISLDISSLSAMKALLSAPGVITAAKLLNLRLMKKGKNMYGRSHAFDLANAVFGGNA